MVAVGADDFLPMFTYVLVGLLMHPLSPIVVSNPSL